jgi:hypothetical protein
VLRLHPRSLALLPPPFALRKLMWSRPLAIQVSSGSETIDLNSVENFYHTYPGDVFYAKALVAVS